MINSAPNPPLPAAQEDEAVDAIVRAGPGGALLLAGIASAIVVAIWLAFYILVFLARVTPA